MMDLYLAGDLIAFSKQQFRWPSGKSIYLWSCKLGFHPSRVKPMTLKWVFTASLLDAYHYGDSVENKPASLLVPLEKALNEILPFLCGR